MPPTSGLKVLISLPGTTLQQMCNFVAIAETKNPAESLRVIIIHTLLAFEEEKISTVQELSSILKGMFGVEAPDHQVQESLDHLISSGHIHRPLETNYTLTSDTRNTAKARIDQAAMLQERVRFQWLTEIERQFPELDADVAWDALQDYLAKAFLRHGMQVAVFLDPSIELPAEYSASLSSLLFGAVNAKFDSKNQTSARQAISGFLASAGKNRDRAQFIAECADGAANYFSLAVSPDVAARFREKLSPLTLFCDTNFLFGILDLHVHPLVDVSNELVNAISKYKLPLKLRYHVSTLKELQSSISHYNEILRRYNWTQALSRAASNSRFISGIELKYHQKNAENKINVETFFRPYQHVDILLKQHRGDCDEGQAFCTFRNGISNESVTRLEGIATYT